MKSFPCPKCKRVLAQSGELTIEGVVMSVFQCDHCTAPSILFGVPFNKSYTFVLRPDGTTFTPPEPDAAEKN